MAEQQTPRDAGALLQETHARVSQVLNGNQSVARLDAADERMVQRARPPVSGDLSVLIERAEIFARSGFFSDAKSVAQAAVKIMIGQSIGLTDIAALSAIYLFESKGRTVITVGAHILAAKIRSSGKYQFKIIETSEKRCQLDFYEKGFLDEAGWSKVGESVFTIEEAIAADLLKKDNWKGYPQDMLYARAMGRGFRRFTSDLTAIVPYTPEEFAGTDFRPAGMVMEVPQPEASAAINVAPRRASEAAAELRWPADRREEWVTAHEGADMPQCQQSGCEACRWDSWETFCAACGEPMARAVHSECNVAAAAEPEQPTTPPLTGTVAAAIDAETVETRAIQELPPTGDRAAVEAEIMGSVCPKRGHGRYHGLFCPVCSDPTLLREVRK